MKTDNKDFEIEKLKDYVSKLEYNLRCSNYREGLAKKLLDETKRNYRYLLHKKAAEYNDLLYKINENLDNAIIINVVKDYDEDEKIEIYDNRKMTVEDVFFDICSEYDFEGNIEITRTTFITSDNKHLDIPTIKIDD